MTSLIIIFGALICLAGVIIIINPENIFGLITEHVEKPALHILAVVVRLILGFLLIYYADDSKYPLVIEIIGWISVVAAVILTVIGRDNFKRLIAWALTLTKPLGRAGGVLAICLGAFLVYAFT